MILMMRTPFSGAFPAFFAFCTFPERESPSAATRRSLVRSRFTRDRHNLAIDSGHLAASSAALGRAVERENQFAGVLTAKQRQQDLGKVTDVAVDDLLMRTQLTSL